MDTESDQSSGNRYIASSLEDSREEERQRTGLFRWDDPKNLMPSWSVPLGLIVTGPRHPESDAQLPGSAPEPPESDAQPPGSALEPPESDAQLSESDAKTATDEPASDDNSWPGVAPPAGWFLRAAGSPPNAHQESASAWPGASGGPNASAVPSPAREPDGSRSSPLTPKPECRRLGPTRARYGRAGGPGFQPARSGQPGPEGESTDNPGPSPWQRSHRLWTEAGIDWERRSAPKLPDPRPPTAPAQQAQGWHIRSRAMEGPAPSRPSASAPERWPAPPPQYAPPPQPESSQRLAAPQWPDSHVPAGWPGRVPVPLGAPVYSDPGVDEDDGPTREDRWGDDRPPIWERPPGLVPTADPEDPADLYDPADLDDPDDSDALDRAPVGDTPLFDHQMPGSRRSGHGPRGRRPMTIVMPAIVVVAVAVLALALLTGHGPRFGPLSSDPHKTPHTAAPRLPMGAVTFDTYPGQQQRGVFQVISRIVAYGGTLVTTGWQSSDGVVRQQFLVSTNGGASWHLAPVRAPGGGAPALGHPATRLAGGPGGWVAVGPAAIWTSPTGQIWTLAATHGISPQLPGDSVWVITKTASGYLAAGRGAGPGQGHHTAVIWTSRDGMIWQRMTAAQLGLAAPGETVQSISYATWRGQATVISGAVSNTEVNGYDVAWLSTNGGTTWTRLSIPADHGARAAISGLGFDGSGLIAVRPGGTVSGAADGIAYFSPDGQTWQYAATIDPDSKAGGWTPRVVKGSTYGFVVTGISAEGQLVAYTSSGTGTSWLPAGPLGSAAVASVSGATVGPGGSVIAIGATAASKVSQQPVFLEAGTDGTVRTVPLAGMAGAVVPEMKINGTAVANGQQIAVGSANGYPAVWRRIPGGAWTLVSSLGLVAADPHLRSLTSVTHGPAGWLAVGAPGPVVLSSPDGEIWGVAGGNIAHHLAGVSAAAAAAGPAGYVIVGKLVRPGGGCVADVWWSANMMSWTRAHDVNAADGSSQVLAVTAGAHGFVSAGSHNGQPTVWTTADGRAWKTIVLPPPAGASAAVLQQVAVNGDRVAVLGTATIGTGGAVGSATATGPDTVPFAELSTDGGATWQQVPFGSPGPYTSFTALTANGAGFTAAGLFGQPGHQDVALWASTNGTSWKPYQSGGLNGSGAWQIDALARSGAEATGIGTILAQQSQQTVTFTLPPR